MRIFFSICIFLAFAIRPAIEISTILYYQLNIDYIVEKYCVNKERPALNCNGKCYLMTQMQGKTKTPTTDNSEAIVITESFIPLYFQEIKLHLTNDSLTTLSYTTQHWKIDQFHDLETSEDIDRPPQC